jgi:hypothetical protein
VRRARQGERRRWRPPSLDNQTSTSIFPPHFLFFYILIAAKSHHQRAVDRPVNSCQLEYRLQLPKPDALLISPAAYSGHPPTNQHLTLIVNLASTSASLLCIPTAAAHRLAECWPSLSVVQSLPAHADLERSCHLHDLGPFFFSLCQPALVDRSPLIPLSPLRRCLNTCARRCGYRTFFT